MRWWQALLACAVFVAAPAVRAAAAGSPRVDLEAARAVLFEARPDAKAMASCSGGPEHAQIVCLLRARYAADPKAAQIAVDLYEHNGTVAGMLPEEDFDGGYRGVIHLVPHLPVGETRQHLQWVAAALTDYDAFFAGQEKVSGSAASYRWQALEVRFTSSEKKKTPAAFAQSWSVAYNVNGTLNGSATAVRELLFHEIFHLNDHAHGDWSETALAPIFDPIAERCGTTVACLTPYSPDYLIVRGGTYYPFMPGNGVREYAADLALRYYREQRSAAQGSPPARPFKCGPPENAAAWDKLVREFFGGVDRIPPCPARKPK